MPTPVNDETANIDAMPKPLTNKEGVIYTQKRNAVPPLKLTPPRQKSYMANKKTKQLQRPMK